MKSASQVLGGSSEYRDQLMEEAQIHSLGKDLTSRFAMLLKTARIHSVHNSALQYSIKIFVDASNTLVLHLGEFTLRGDEDSVFINDMRIRPETILWDNIVHLMGEMANRGLGGLHITGPVLPIQVRHMLDTFLWRDRIEKDGARILNERLSAAGVDQIKFLPRLSLVLEAEKIGSHEEVAALASVHAYTQLLATWKAYLSIDQYEVPEVIRNRLLHTVQDAVDMLHDDPEWFITSAAFRRSDDLRAVHACNVAVLCLALGHRLELGRKGLMNLGMAALYADSGLRRIPSHYHVCALTGGVPAPELAAHPYESVKEVLHTPALTRAQRDRLMVAYEHHIGRNGQGYPPPLPGKGLHLFSAIVGLADRFVELTTELPGVPAMSMSRALEVIAQEEDRYDPRLMRIFLHMLGPFPVGSIVNLSTGETAVVFRQSADPRFRPRPLVKIVRSARGEVVAPTMFDLTACDDHGNFLARIVDTTTPQQSGVDVIRVLFSDASSGGRPRMA